MAKPLQKFLLKLILENAIQYEERAYRFYESALQKSVMNESFDLLRKLLGEELRHRIRLEEAQRDGDTGALLEGEAASGEDPLLKDPLSPEETEDFCAEWPDIEDMTSARNILETALRKERCALIFYREMMERSRLKPVRDLFAALYKGEKRHLRWVSEEIERLRS